LLGKGLQAHGCLAVLFGGIHDLILPAH
jgi:hypothetical protein